MRRMSRRSRSPAPPSDQSWLTGRADVQLFSAQIEAADRVYRDSWRDWVPTASVSFEPQLVAPAGLFQPSRTWRGFVALSVPIFDGGARRAEQALARGRAGDRPHPAHRRRAARALGVANGAGGDRERQRAAVQARLAAQHATEVLRITDVAFRAGATTNIELIDAPAGSRDADAAAAIAEDRLRQARLDLARSRLGRFSSVSTICWFHCRCRQPSFVRLPACMYVRQR